MTKTETEIETIKAIDMKPCLGIVFFGTLTGTAPHWLSLHWDRLEIVCYHGVLLLFAGLTYLHNRRKK